MTFAAIFGASLWSGYASRRATPKMAAHHGNRQRLHLSRAETCPDEAGHLWLPGCPAHLRMAIAYLVNDAGVGLFQFGQPPRGGGSTPDAIPAGFRHDPRLGFVDDIPIIGPALRFQLACPARNLGDVDRPFRVDCLDEASAFAQSNLQHGLRSAPTGS